MNANDKRYKDAWRDGARTIDSIYFNAICEKKVSWNCSAAHLMGLKIAIATNAVQKEGGDYVDQSLCQNLLRTIALSTPPYGEVGQEFLEKELKCTKKQAYVAIAKDLKLSDAIQKELQSDVPLSREGYIVRYIEETFDSIPKLTDGLIQSLWSVAEYKNNIIDQFEKVLKKAEKKEKSVISKLQKQRAFAIINAELDWWQEKEPKDRLLHFLEFGDIHPIDDFNNYKHMHRLKPEIRKELFKDL